MAAKTTRKTRRRSTTKARRTTRRRSGGFGARKGFISSDLLITAGGFAGGALAAEFIAPRIPIPAIGGLGLLPQKALIAAGSYYGLRRIAPKLAVGMAAGAIGSAILDFVRPMLFRPAGAPGVAGYELDSSMGSPDTFTLDDGTQVQGYLMDDGSVLDGLGNYVADFAA